MIFDSLQGYVYKIEKERVSRKGNLYTVVIVLEPVESIHNPFKVAEKRVVFFNEKIELLKDLKYGDYVTLGIDYGQRKASMIDDEGLKNVRIEHFFVGTSVYGKIRFQNSKKEQIYKYHIFKDKSFLK